MASSSPPHQPPPFSDYLDPPLGIPLLLPAPPPPPPPPSRRLPPPCWTPDETSALIDAYRDKWYSLRRGNLRAAHWQDVADTIHRLCPHVSPPKTSVQCRHKMEKLRKRYRSELQRAKSIPHHRFSSSWIYFSKMDSMEKGNSGPASSAGNGGFNGVDEEEEEDGGNDDDDVNDEDYGVGGSFGKGVKNYGRNGLKIRIAGNSNSNLNLRKNYGGFQEISNPNPNPRFGFNSSIQSRCNEFGSPPNQFDVGPRYSGSYGSNGGGGFSSGNGLGVMKMIKKKRSALGKKEGRREAGDNVAMAMVEAIRMLGEGYVRTEMTKMEMVRDSEKARMDIEMNRTRMMLEYHQSIVETFVRGWSDHFVDNNDDDDDDDRNSEGDASPPRC
ncbi:trihelix transcription factor ASIL2-like [Chenopodium quinoa]|uniref:trihelix transcription factor ASIL2-like n=1 Tax=Chenopodium quinoa TaxID=63459 RepID=UPI000B774CCD|nr:trihelix transcription factor ASIL2-like [Chenopodium quinoa]